MQRTLNLYRRWTFFAMLTAAFCTVAATADRAPAEDKAETVKLGKIQMAAPEGWKKVQPRVRIIAYEFSAPAAKEDKQNGRCTIMAAGGTVDANLKRWYGQFTQPDGGNTQDRAKLEKEKIAGRTVHLVSIAGTFKDQRGPFAPAVMRDDYRMLGAIIEAPDANYFVKFYGPKRTVDAHEKSFRAMVESLE